METLGAVFMISLFVIFCAYTIAKLFTIKRD